MPSTISLQSIIDWVTTNVRGAGLSDVLGIQNEPALSLCNDVYQQVLQQPLTWRFNKANTANSGLGILYWTTTQYQQDYQLTNATANVPAVQGMNPIGGGVVHIATVFNNGVVCDGTTATVTCNWNHNASPGQNVTMLNVGSWTAGIFVPDVSGLLNGTFPILTTPTPTTFTFASTAPAGVYGAPGINDIGWIERCVLEDWASTATVKPRHSIEVTMNLELESIIQPPFKISYQYTNTDIGSATGQLIPSTTAVFRLWPIPSSQIWGVMADYQMAPQTFSDLLNTWGVWPDPLISVIRQGVKAAVLDFVEDPRAQSEYQIFMLKLEQIKDIRDQERPSQTMFPDRPILFGG